MKIIILAAGIGSRLGNPFPKLLTPLKEKKELLKQHKAKKILLCATTFFPSFTPRRSTEEVGKSSRK